MNYLTSDMSVITMTKKMASFLFILTCFDSLVTCKLINQNLLRTRKNLILFHLGVECATQKEIDQHLTLGMQLLSRGQYSDALSHFHAAVGKSFEALTCVKTYFMSFYRRRSKQLHVVLQKSNGVFGFESLTTGSFRSR